MIEHDRTPMFIGFHLIVSYSFGFLFGFLGVVEFAETHANMGVLDPSKMHAKSCKHDQMCKDRLQSGRAGEHSNNLYASVRLCHWANFPTPSPTFEFHARGMLRFWAWPKLRGSEQPNRSGTTAPMTTPFTLSQRETLKRNANAEFRVEVFD